MSDSQALLVRGTAEAESDQRSRRFTSISHSTAVIGVTAALVLIVLDQPLASLAIATVLWGWSEVDGNCGTSHFCTISPLRALDASGKLWRRAAIAYLLGGIATGSLVGSFVGGLGLLLGGQRTAALLIVAGAAIVLLARELKVFWFRLPQVWRQTHKQWAFEYGMIPAAAMWGAHIGLGYATVIKHGGFFVLIGFTLLLGPLAGALLMATYWFGRALPILAAPLIASDCGDGGKLFHMIDDSSAACRHVAAAGLTVGAIVALYLVRG